MGMERGDPEEILQKAVEILDPVERVAYLDRACGDNGTLRAEIEARPEAHQEAGMFLDAPVLESVISLTRAGPANTIQGMIDEGKEK